MSRPSQYEPRIEGINAYHDLLELDANPYKAKTNKNRMWTEGWEWAKNREINPVYWGDIVK